MAMGNEKVRLRVCAGETFSIAGKYEAPCASHGE